VVIFKLNEKNLVLKLIIQAILKGSGVMAEYMESIISILDKTVQNKDYLKNFSHLVDTNEFFI
jgi:hypothetical protein